MLIGNEFYGNKSKFEKPVEEEGENENKAFIKMKTNIDKGVKMDPNA